MFCSGILLPDGGIVVEGRRRRAEALSLFPASPLQISTATMSLGLSKGILKLPPSLRAPHLQSLLPSDRLSLSTPSPLIHFSSPVPAPDSLPQGFTLFPSFFSITEQRILLESALQRLDAIGGIRRVDGKKVRRTKAQVAADKEEKGLQGFFMSADAYTFEEGHFDGVIRHYRESLVSSGLPDVVSASDKNSYLPKPSQLLERLHRFFVDPSKRLITHALHLAPGGRIDPHVDSLEAMGETIVGVSLGADRVLRLERDGAGIIEVLLKSGSVYVQSSVLLSSLLSPRFETHDLIVSKR